MASISDVPERYIFATQVAFNVDTAIIDARLTRLAARHMWINHRPVPRQRFRGRRLPTPWRLKLPQRPSSSPPARSGAGTQTGCRWRDVPPEYSPATTVYNRYNRWSQRGLWQRLFEQIAASGDVPHELSLDSSHVKAHRSAAGAKGEWAQAVGRSRGGRTSKIHGQADDRGRPVA
jgi:transposase